MDIKKDEVCVSVHEDLKPLCNSLLLNPTKQNITQLKQFLPKIPPQVLQMYQNYILFPIELHLYQVENTEIQRHLVDCLATLIKLTYITSVNKLIHLSGLLYQRISSGKDHVSLAEVSEELKLSVVQCIKILFIRADSTVLHEFYTRKFYPRLSSLVFICSLIAKEERLIHLRVAALECILTLANVNDTSNSEDTPLRNSVRNIIMLMLPGIISTCAAIANDSDLQNHNISVANLKVWSQMISLVMEDDKNEFQSFDMATILQNIKKVSVTKKTNTREAKINIPATNLKEKIENIKKQERTEKWLSEAAKKLVGFTKEMTKYQSHSHYATRKQLSISCQFILQKCSRNMAPSVSELVSTLIILSQDEMQEVTVVAQEALKWFASECEQESGKSLFEILEEDFYALLSRMPRIMREQDEKRQLSCLSLLEGYLKLQDKKLPQVLSSRSVLNRLIMSLILTVSIETSGIILLEDCSVRALVDSGNLLHLIHALLEALDEMADHRKEITLILNMMLTSSPPNSMEQHAELIHNVVEIYLEPRFWNLPISVTQGVDLADNILQAQSNVIQTCLLVEGIGKFALVLGGSAFSSCLISCLYPTLERAGSPLALIATAGLGALQNIAKACVGGGVTDLVRNNVDYLSHHITTRLRNAHRNPSVLPVLSVVMKHSTVDVLPSLHEIITDVLVQSCDVFQEQSGSAYLHVFYTFMVCVNNWYKEDFLLTTQTIQEPPNIVQKLLEYKQLKNEANNFGDIDETKTVEEMFREDESKRQLEEVIEEEPTNDKKQLPPHIELTVDILNRSLHFLPSKDEGRQILVLQILRVGVLILKNYEEQLLPTVHKIWSPLVNRFQSSITKPLVMQYAFQLLCVLASAAKDFIRSRTLKSVLPSLCEILLQSVNQSRLKDSGSVYRHTQLYKLQSHLLSNLGQLVIDIGLQERDLYLILSAVTPYLSVQQPIPLQEESKSLFKTISTLNQDIVWLQLLSIWTPTVKLEPSSTGFQVVKLTTNDMDSSEFKKNVSEVFESLT